MKDLRGGQNGRPARTLARALARAQAQAQAVACLWLAAGAVVGTANAHHSSSMYETDRPVQLHGAVVGFEWQNPHSFLSLRVTDAQGHAVNYDLECASISRLQKMGWARDTFTPGSQVTATVALRRDDAKRGEVLTLTLQDGRTLQNQVGR